MRIVGDRTCASVVEPGGLEFVRSEISVAKMETKQGSLAQVDSLDVLISQQANSDSDH